MVLETTDSPTTEAQAPVAEGTTKPEAAMPDERRDELASKLVDRFVLWSGAAGLIPVPIADVAAVGGLQIQMVRRLSKIYGVPFSDNLGKSVIYSVLGSVVPTATAGTAISALKGLPFIGTTIGVLTMPAFTAGATYLLGKVFIQHFASGGTLLDFHVSDYGDAIKKHARDYRARFKTAVTPSPATHAESSPQPSSGTEPAATST